MTREVTATRSMEPTTMITGCGRIPQGKDVHMATRKAMSAVDKPKKVFICSPFRGLGTTEEEAWQDYKNNLELARFACRYAVRKGYQPYAPHLYFPRFLLDSVPEERDKGISMGLSWLAQCDELWVIDKKITVGMKREIDKAQAWGIRIVRYLPERTPEERLLDAILNPETKFKEMI